MHSPLILATVLAAGSLNGVLAASVQAPFIGLPPDAHMHQQAVVNLMLDSYQAYKWVEP